jgi:hypothetical protein
LTLCMSMKLGSMETLSLHPWPAVYPCLPYTHISAVQSAAEAIESNIAIHNLFDIWTEREERVTLCLWRAYVLVLIKIKLCCTD